MKSGRRDEKMSQEVEGPISCTMNNNNEEDDYEDMVTPTDDEGITSLNHTQKIPISLIKAKDKASVSYALLMAALNLAQGRPYLVWI